MKIPVYNQKGEKVGEALLPKAVFEVPMNSDLLHQVVVSQMANRRRVIAKTKDRAEVSGGGRKPWRQKGTGRARHGSIRSPIWKGGGVTFGPTNERVFKKEIPRKIRRKAIFIVLSAKAKENSLLLMDELKLEKPKTKLANEIFKKLPLNEKSTLVVIPEKNENVVRAARNISNIRIISVNDLNALDLLSYKYLIMPKETIKAIEKIFLK